MIELTDAQPQTLATADKSPPIMIDPQTKEVYVLLRKEFYDRFKHVLEDDDARAMAPLLANLDPEDWEDAAAYEGKP